MTTDKPLSYDEALTEAANALKVGGPNSHQKAELWLRYAELQRIRDIDLNDMGQQK